WGVCGWPFGVGLRHVCEPSHLAGGSNGALGRIPTECFHTAASLARRPPHPLPPLADLPGAAPAGDDAREALGKAHRHRTNLRGWPATAAEAALRAARASSVLDGGALPLTGEGGADP